MSAHTPGPWAVTSKYGDIKDEVAAGSRAVATVWTRKFETKFKGQQHVSAPVPDVEGEANARLIAQAPVMYSVLKRLLDRDDKRIGIQNEAAAILAAVEGK